MKLAEHEKSKDEVKSSLQKELIELKVSARRKAKEHSIEANILYEKLQSKVDARVTDWCSRQVKVNARAADHSVATPTPRPSARPKAGSLAGLASPKRPT